MKQKLLRNRLIGAEHGSDEIDEEEKKRIVLGAVRSFISQKFSKHYPIYGNVFLY